MPHAKLQALLDATVAQIATAEAQAMNQRAIIDELRSQGLEIGGAQTLLTLFETTVALHVAERDRLAAVLAAVDRQT
jgi:hypothetical protein